MLVQVVDDLQLRVVHRDAPWRPVQECGGLVRDRAREGLVAVWVLADAGEDAEQRVLCRVAHALHGLGHGFGGLDPVDPEGIVVVAEELGEGFGIKDP